MIKNMGVDENILSIQATPVLSSTPTPTPTPTPTLTPTATALNSAFCLESPSASCVVNFNTSFQAINQSLGLTFEISNPTGGPYNNIWSIIVDLEFYWYGPTPTWALNDGWTDSSLPVTARQLMADIDGGASLWEHTRKGIINVNHQEPLSGGGSDSYKFRISDFTITPSSQSGYYIWQINGVIQDLFYTNPTNGRWLVNTPISVSFLVNYNDVITNTTSSVSQESSNYSGINFINSYALSINGDQYSCAIPTSHQVNMSGGIVLSSPASRNYDATLYFDLPSTYKIYGNGSEDFLLQLNSNWNISYGKYYWWRILGCAAGKAPEENILSNQTLRLSNNPIVDLGPHQNNLSIQSVVPRRVSQKYINLYDQAKSPKCGPQKIQMITAVVARDLLEVCELLKSPTVGPKIDLQIISIKKYIDPINEPNNTSGIRSILEEQEFCNIPECMELCLDFDLAQEIASSGIYGSIIYEMFVAFSQYYESNLEIKFGGKAQVLYFWQTAQGGMQLNGTASLLSSKFRYNSVARINILGQAVFLISPLLRNFSGLIEFGGLTKDVISPYHQYKFEGAIKINPEFIINQVFVFPSYLLIDINGSAEISYSKKFILEPTGRIYFNGSSDIYNNRYYYTPVSGLMLEGGVTDVISSNFHYQSQGSIDLSGCMNRLGRCFTPTDCEILLDGSALNDNPIALFRFTGGVQIGGSVEDVISPSHCFKSSDCELELDGSSYVSFTNLGLLVSEMYFDSYLFNTSLESAIQDEFSNITINQGLVNSCGCLNVGLNINLNTNISNSGILGDFLTRNSIKLGPDLPIRYKKSPDSWTNIIQYSGLAYDNSTEYWTLIFTLSCTNQIENQIYDDYFLKFTFIARQKLLDKVRQTILNVNIDSNQVCSNSVLSSKISYQNKIILVDGVETDFNLVDNVGLFENNYWNNKLNYNNFRGGKSQGAETTGRYPEFKLNYIGALTSPYNIILEKPISINV